MEKLEMEKKVFLDDNIQTIVDTLNAIYDKYPADRDDGLNNELNILAAGIDSYIVEYYGKIEGSVLGNEFEVVRIPNKETEEHPVCISSTEWYMQDGEKNSNNVWWDYDKNGEVVNTYSLGSQYFPDSYRVKEYIETGHIDFDMESINTIIEKYKNIVIEKQSKAQATHEIEEFAEAVADRKFGNVNSIISEIKEEMESNQNKDGVTQGD